MSQAATAVEETQEQAKTSVRNVEFSEVSDTNARGQAGSIDILLDMDVPITVTIGQTEIPVRRLLQLTQGSVIKLDKPIDEPLDLYLSGSKFATGSVVVVDGCFAIKIKSIIGLDNTEENNKN